MPILCTGNIAHRIAALAYSLSHRCPIVWRNDHKYVAHYEDIFDNDVEILYDTTIAEEQWIPLYGYSKLLFKPGIMSRAEKTAQLLGISEYVGVDIKSARVEDNGKPLYFYAENKSEIGEARKRWGGNRVFAYSTRKVWGSHRLDGCEEEAVSFLLYSMCGTVNVDSYNGLVAFRLKNSK